MDPQGDAADDVTQFAASSVLTDLSLALLQDSGWCVYMLLVSESTGSTDIKVAIGNPLIGLTM